MPRDATIVDRDRDRPILPWRMVAGLFLHCIVPFYLIALVADVLLAGPRAWDAEAALRQALAVSPVLLGGYLACAVLATLGAALLDPPLRARRARHAANDPCLLAERMERAVLAAIDRSQGRFSPRSDAALARLRAARRDFADPAQQALARDLVEAAHSSLAALDSAPPGQRDGIAALAGATFERLAAAQEELARASGREAERQARVIAGYVEMRYGPSDFSGSAD